MGKLKTNSRKVFCRVLPLLAALILILGSCLTVSAEEINISLPTDKNLYKYNTVIYTPNVSDGYYYVLHSSECEYIYSEGYIYDTVSDLNFKYLKSTDGINWTKESNTLKTATNTRWCPNENNILVFSDYTIKDSNGEVFFQGPVPPLVKAAEGIAPEEVMKETIGLLPLLIPFLVGLVGFWKGWQFLLQILRKA